MEAIDAVCVAVKAYLDEHPHVIHDPMDSGDRAWCALQSLGPDGIMIGVKCTLRKMGSQVFALEQGGDVRRSVVIRLLILQSLEDVPYWFTADPERIARAYS